MERTADKPACSEGDFIADMTTSYASQLPDRYQGDQDLIESVFLEVLTIAEYIAEGLSVTENLLKNE